MCVTGLCACVCRYQPGMLIFSSQNEKLVELVGGEKVAVSGDSGDEYGLDSEDHLPREKFSFKLLLVPSRDSPTKMSGTIVYAVTVIICKNCASPFIFLFFYFLLCALSVISVGLHSRAK